MARSLRAEQPAGRNAGADRRHRDLCRDPRESLRPAVGATRMTAATVAVDLALPITCPLCHTAAPTVSAADLASGLGWRCGTCDQRWDAAAFAAGVGYAA